MLNMLPVVSRFLLQSELLLKILPKITPGSELRHIWLLIPIFWTRAGREGGCRCSVRIKDRNSKIGVGFLDYPVSHSRVCVALKQI